MYGPSEWRGCPYCSYRKYCSPESIRDHIEDCPERPSLKQMPKRHYCPKCQQEMIITTAGTVCTNNACDYVLDVIVGGKLQQ